MTQYLPPNLLALFAPRDPMPFMPPLDKLSWEKKSNGYSGIAQCLQEFEDPKDTPPPTRVETKDERKDRKRKERAEQVAYKLEQDLALWDPASEHPGDPFKTLFVARINYDTSESKLRREFEVYGPVKKISVSYNKRSGKPRGFAFIEYEHERDMHSAYKHADGKKLDGRRVLVDVERGRTVKGWRPRRLGGGLGGTRKGGPDVNTRYSGRDDNMRERSRSREPARGRSRSKSREVRRPRRSRSRERRRSRDRGRRDDDRKRSRRSRSRDRHRSRSRDRKRRRSRSRERRRERRGGDDEEARIRVKQEKGTYEGYGDDSLTAKQLTTKTEPNYENGDEGGGGDREDPPDTKEGILDSVNEYGSVPAPPLPDDDQE